MKHVVLGLIAAALLCGFASPALASTERISITFTQEGGGPGAGAATQIYDSAGRNVGCHVPFTAQPSCHDDIPNSHVDASGTSISFVDDDATPSRCYRVTANDTDGPSNPPSPVAVRATLHNPDGSTTEVGPFTLQNGDQIYLGSTPPEPGLTPGGPVPASQCTDPAGNRPPVAVRDLYKVRAGWTLDENLLRNDYDPDGDPITPKVLQISFARKEWSGLERDGSFLYTAGPGTSRVLLKRITYVVIDSHGAQSQPVTSVVRVRPWKPSRRNPLTHKSASAAAPYWIGPSGAWVRLCFGRALKTQCFMLLSVSNTQALNALTPWATLDGAVSACVKFGFIPLNNRECAKKLLEKGLFQVWDKSVVSNASKFQDCLLFRVGRHRTIRHPLAGEWGAPEYRTLDSLVKPFNGNQRFSGWGTWGKWRVPVFCGRDGRVLGKVNTDLALKP